MNKLLDYLILPSAITPFEERYLRRVNKIALAFFWLHPPVFALVAMLAGTNIGVAVALSLGAMVGPTIAYFGFRSRPRVVGMIYGVTAMLMGGVLVFVGQGPMQIEMHFYFFVLIALLAVFGNPMVIVVAAVTVAAHHFVVWLMLPSGVFNYDASFWTVAVHATFVVIESIAACFVARSFFDNVIGLEQIVERRTSALDSRNRDMTRILDNVAQGFVSVSIDGTIGGEWSRALARWFGEPGKDVKLWSYLPLTDDQQAWMQIGFDSLVEGFMPTEIVLEQLPRNLARDGREFRISFQAIEEGLLVVISDVTDEVARQRAERAQRELITVVEIAFRDRAGFTTFLAETDSLVDKCTGEQTPEMLPELKRVLHTLKGNCALFGVTSMSSLAHELESSIAETGDPPGADRRALVAQVWASFHDRIERVLGITNSRALLIDWDDYQSVVAAIAIEPEPPWAARIRDWGRTSTRARLEHCAHYARALADRLGKPNVQVHVLDHGVKLFGDEHAAIWPAFVHAVRNMVDHGIEDPTRRRAAGKTEAATITLETRLDADDFRVEISDDGAGIDWDRIAVKAREHGLRADTPADLEEALFASNVSTAEQATEVSGRGVGMDALRSACAGMGGRIELHSVRGQGTRFTCVLPRRRARPDQSMAA